MSDTLSKAADELFGDMIAAFVAHQDAELVHHSCVFVAMICRHNLSVLYGDGPFKVYRVQDCVVIAGVGPNPIAAARDWAAKNGVVWPERKES